MGNYETIRFIIFVILKGLDDDVFGNKYLFAVTGKAFGVIRNEHKDLLNKVRQIN